MTEFSQVETIKNLRIDVERLRKALGVIAYAKGGAGPALRECVVIARAALEDTK
jgi:hypothetical protein